MASSDELVLHKTGDGNKNPIYQQAQYEKEHTHKKKNPACDSNVWYVLQGKYKTGKAAVGTASRCSEFLPTHIFPPGIVRGKIWAKESSEVN